MTAKTLKCYFNIEYETNKKGTLTLVFSLTVPVSLGRKESALKTFKSTTKLKPITSSSEIGVFYNFMFVILCIS